MRDARKHTGSAASAILRRALRAKGFAAVTLAVFVTGMPAAVKPPGRAQAASDLRQKAGKHHARLLRRWQVLGPLKREGKAAKYAIGLGHRSGLRYPMIERNRAVIPAIRTQLVLPAGVKLLRGGSHKSQFSDRLWRSHWRRPIPKTNLRWRIFHGVPTWTALDVGPSAPRVSFWISGRPGQCFLAKSTVMYHHGGGWKRIPHTPVQTAWTCLPSPGTTARTAGSGKPSPKWTNVVDDQFDGGELPSHWTPYSSPYGSAPHNCTDPAHDFVSGGYLHIVESYESSKPGGVNCPYGAGWYTGGLALPKTAPYSANNQRVTVRFRIVSVGGVVPHYIIPMRMADNSEEDFFESDGLSRGYTFLHRARGRVMSTPAYSIDVTRWHTIRFTQVNHLVSAYIDDMTHPVWVYEGNSTTTPDTGLWRHVVLQQECSHANGCPRGTTGRSDIEVDWIRVDDASWAGSAQPLAPR